MRHTLPRACHCTFIVNSLQLRVPFRHHNLAVNFTSHPQQHMMGSLLIKLLISLAKRSNRPQQFYHRLTVTSKRLHAEESKCTHARPPRPLQPQTRYTLALWNIKQGSPLDMASLLTRTNCCHTATAWPAINYSDDNPQPPIILMTVFEPSARAQVPRLQ